MRILRVACSNIWKCHHAAFVQCNVVKPMNIAATGHIYVKLSTSNSINLIGHNTPSHQPLYLSHLRNMQVPYPSQSSLDEQTTNGVPHTILQWDGDPWTFISYEIAKIQSCFTHIYRIYNAIIMHNRILSPVQVQCMCVCTALTVQGAICVYVVYVQAMIEDWDIIVGMNCCSFLLSMQHVHFVKWLTLFTIVSIR